MLRRHLRLGNIVSPKSVTPSRIKENLDVLGFGLEEDDRARIAGLDVGERLGPNPVTFT